MGNIYRESEQVIIWLGEGTEETDLIMASMQQLQEHNLYVAGDWRPLAKFWMDNWPGIHTTQSDLKSLLRKAMEQILRRPWFRRIWILQEIANARVAIILCGKKSISSRIFAQVPSLIGLKPDPHCQAVLDIMPGLSRK